MLNHAANTIEKYRVKEKINTLFVIEGELKSLAASINGIDAIGLGSIHGFYAPADNNRPYFKEFAPEIIQLIKECKVESIVYVTDADTLSLSYDYDVTNLVYLLAGLDRMKIIHLKLTRLL